MRAVGTSPTLAHTGRGGEPLAPTVPSYPPGQLWVRSRALDTAGSQLHVQLCNDAMAPLWPAGTWLSAYEVQAAGPLTPGLYLVRWPDEPHALMSYVGRLLLDGLQPDRLVFDFDGVLPEPIVCSIPRTGQQAHRARLYRVALLRSEQGAA